MLGEFYYDKRESTIRRKMMRRTKYTEVSPGEIDQMKRALEKCKVNPAKRYELEVTDQEMSFQEMSFQGQPVTSLSLLDMSTPKGAPIVSGLKSLKELDSAIPPPNTPTVPHAMGWTPLWHNSRTLRWFWMQGLAPPSHRCSCPWR